MIQLEVPHVNILSKVDLMEQYGKLGKYVLVWKIQKYVCTTQHLDWNTIQRLWTCLTYWSVCQRAISS